MRFPGVRADNDMYTYGFSFDPWKGAIIGNGQEIREYLGQVTEKFNIKKHILFNTEVLSLSWKNNQWITKTNSQKFSSQYVICCTGSRDKKTHIYQNLEMKKNIKGKLYIHKSGEILNLKTKM